MKKWQKWMISGLAAAGLAAASKGEICSTWEFPDNERALQEEYEASTNVTEVLTVGRTLDKEGVVVQFRKRAVVSEEAGAGTGNDGDFGVLVLNETAFLASARLIGAARGGGSGGQAVAWDQSHNYEGRSVGYKEGDKLGTVNDGEGWKEGWSVPSGVSAIVLGEWSPIGSTYTFHGFQVENASGGFASVTRPFESEMESGTLTVSSLGVPMETEFAGFSLYGWKDENKTEMEELFRWGALNYYLAQGYGKGFAYSDRRALTDYTMVPDEKEDEGYALYHSGDVDYTLTWVRNGSGLDLWLSAIYTNDRDKYDSIFDPIQIQLASAGPVAGFGVSLSNGGTMIFDYLYVEGRAVPEPGTLALLAVGALGLARRRKGRVNRAG
ncbi:MAG: PEP-CTERM sorting domain-containing protein [Kiritimatiellae bacterium]|nr:PEP-CTERM sorting domain-containing protein [Kiritimatiellia bacterium]